MKLTHRRLPALMVILVLLFVTDTVVQGQGGIAINDRFANANGVRLHYL